MWLFMMYVNNTSGYQTLHQNKENTHTKILKKYGTTTMKKVLL